MNKKYKNVVIGIDQSYKNTGITIVADAEIKIIKAINLAEYKSNLVSAPEISDNEDIRSKKYWQEQLDRINERFPEWKYQDVIWLCKVAKLEWEDWIIDQDYSLNAWRYVWVVIEDDWMTEEEFKDKMIGLNNEFKTLSNEAKDLERQIDENLNSLFK